MSDNTDTAPFVIPDVMIAVAQLARKLKRDRESKDHKVKFFGKWILSFSCS